jgi:tRNA modification GTPase
LVTDTIAAIATAPGAAGLGVVRVSGPEAVSVTARLVGAAPDLERAASHTVHHAWLRDATGRPLDEALVTVMRAPRTFTGEDVVEIGVHGGAVPSRRVLHALFAAGARPAERGEFTKRAFLHGRIDLSQAEAVSDLVSARTELGADVALTALAGGVAKRTREVEDRLIDLLARLEVNLDFVEDVEAAGREEVARGLADAHAALAKLAERAAWGRRLREGALVVLVGEPNVGKSSLFNALLEEDRALVHEVPGTTRDYLEAWIDVDGIPVRLVDTAGLRESADAVEAEGVRRARELVARADLRLHVRDLSVAGPGGSAPRGAAPDDSPVAQPRLLVGNKVDRAGDESMPVVVDVRVSALTGAGIAELRREVGRRLVGGSIPAPDEVLPGERHADALRRAMSSLGRAMGTWNDGGTEELVAGDVRDAATALGEISGRTVGEDVLDRIFSAFCIGK